MADRSLLLPDRAFLETIKNLNTRLMAAERRLRFPGAIRFEELAGPTALTGGMAVNNLITVTLDRGRWLLLAGMWYNATNSPTLSSWQLELALHSVDFPYPAVRARNDDSEVSIISPLFVAHSAIFEQATVVTLRAYWQAFPGGTASSNQAYLIAVPA